MTQWENSHPQAEERDRTIFQTCLCSILNFKPAELQHNTFLLFIPPPQWFSYGSLRWLDNTTNSNSNHRVYSSLPVSTLSNTNVIILNIFTYLIDLCGIFYFHLHFLSHVDDFLSQLGLCHFALTHNPMWTQLPPVWTTTSTPHGYLLAVHRLSQSTPSSPPTWKHPQVTWALTPR